MIHDDAPFSIGLFALRKSPTPPGYFYCPPCQGEIFKGGC